MQTQELLRSLFQAYATGNDAAFLRAAESYIAAELAANHHSEATELQKALYASRKPNGDVMPRQSMAYLPKDRRNGEELVTLHESTISSDMIILTDRVGPRIERVLKEHSARKTLLAHGYPPKNKLLFWGPPGCGKTYTAYYIAHELGIPVGTLRLSAVISSFLGDTASHLQRVFDMASRIPMVLLLDEVDAVGKQRDDPNDVGELKRIVNSLLQLLDGFASSTSIIIAASNHQYMIDPAVWRRFDDVVQFPMPTPKDRREYLNQMLSGVAYSGALPKLAHDLGSASFADIQRAVVEAVKGMLLDGRSKLRTADVRSTHRVMRMAMAEAQARPTRTKR
jgi:SpoVK/Ycf46/Vps4 family AAA+-type ATPase